MAFSAGHSGFSESLSGGGFGSFNDNVGRGSGGGFHPGFNPEMGPGAREQRDRIEAALNAAMGGGWGEQAGRTAWNTIMGMLGFNLGPRQPDYSTGSYTHRLDWSPMGTMGSFMAPLGFNPVAGLQGTIASPSIGLGDISPDMRAPEGRPGDTDMTNEFLKLVREDDPLLAFEMNPLLRLAMREGEE